MPIRSGELATHHRDYSAQRFSPLKQINKDNVKNLHVAWTLQLGGIEGGGIWSHGGLEGTPLAADGYLYVTDGWGSVTKIDTRGGQAKVVWSMDPKTDHDWAGAVACCGVDNRGVALAGNLVLSHSLDGRLIATDKDTGKILWQRQVANPDKGEVATVAPLVVKNLVDLRRVRRRIRHSRLDRGHRPDDAKGGVADLYDPREGRGRQRHLEGQLRRRRRWAAGRPG